MPVKRGARAFKRLSIFTGILSILVTIGLICLALVWGMMLNGRPVEIIAATWMALGLTKYLFNALLVVFSFFTFNSRAASENYMVFLVPSIVLLIWNLAAFPHKLAFGYFAYWAVYSAFLFKNRQAGQESCQPDPVEAEAVCRQGK
jgi:hypothetical protein